MAWWPWDALDPSTALYSGKCPVSVMSPIACLCRVPYEKVPVASQKKCRAYLSSL